MSQLYEQLWLYDLVNGKEPGSEPLAFYERQIARFGQPVLELACGTGDHVVTLSENDYDISGTEKFEDRLNATREKASGRNVETNLFNADMRNFDLGRQFRLIFIAGNALQHLKTTDEVESCFASVRRHLRTGGRFVVEIFNPSVSVLSRDPSQRHFVGEYRTDDGWVVLTTSSRYDAASQINYVNWHYKNQYWKEEQTVSFTMRQFFPQEFDALFARNGFRIEQKFGDFNESPFDSISPRQIVVAESV